MNVREKMCWVGLVVLLWALWMIGQTLVGGAETPPLPPEPVIVVNLGQGAGARALLKRKRTVEPRDYWVEWKYALPVSEYTNVWWNLEASTNMRDWAVVRSNVTGTIDWTNRGERFLAFRLCGRFAP